jgi:hypothetical protein
LVAECHRAQAHDWDLQVAAAQIPVLHGHCHGRWLLLLLASGTSLGVERLYNQIQKLYDRLGRHVCEEREQTAQ